MAQPEIILLNISGTDKPGVISAISQVLTSYGVHILDIGQAVIHDELALGMLFEVPAESGTSPVLKDLLFKAYELGIQAKFTPVGSAEYSDWVAQQGKERYILTALSRRFEARHLAFVSDIIFRQNLNIDYITRLSGRPAIGGSQAGQKASVEFSLRGTPANLSAMKREFLELSQSQGVDLAFQADNIYRRNRRLVCFDMDSTLIQAEVIDELAKYAGAGHQVAEITEQAMRGELDFSESFVRRVGLLKGLPVETLKKVADELPLTEGAERLFSTLRKYGFKTAILSGGFTYFGLYLQQKLGIDYVYANELEIADNKLTGRHRGPIVDGARKALLLTEIAEKEGIHLEQVVAIGDGANDLPMLNLAGLGIAFHAKPKVKESANHAISHIGLDAILYLMGFRDREIGPS